MQVRMEKLFVVVAEPVVAVRTNSDRRSGMVAAVVDETTGWSLQVITSAE